MIRELTNDIVWYTSCSLIGYVVAGRAGMAVCLLASAILVSFGIVHDKGEQDVELQ